jgi:hypothetical protein
VFISLGIALSGVVGIILLWREMKENERYHKIARAVRLFRQQVSKAYDELKSHRRVKSVLNAGKIRKEISEGTAFMRNKIAACDGDRITTDVMLEEMIYDSDILKYPYSRMLSLIRTGQSMHAAEEFSNLTGDKEAKEYANMIVMLDTLDPNDIYEGLVSFQRGLNEEKITQIRKQDEAVSDILYLPVVINLLLIFFNFLYVSYFMQQKEMLAFLM